MTASADALAAIAAAPEGPRVAAFVDLDGTLVSGYTAGAFYLDRMRRLDIGAVEVARTLAVFGDALFGGDPARLGPIGIAGLRGQSAQTLGEIGERLFADELRQTIRPEMREIVRAHAGRGHTVVLATSATRFQAAPIAAELGIDHVLCSEVETDGDRLTGALRDGMLWGPAKAGAARRIAADHGLSLGESFGYANGDEDISLLSSIGRPTAVNPGHLLERAAEIEGWPVLRFDDLGSGGLRSAAGTVTAALGMNAGLALGLAVGVLRGDRRSGANLAAGRSMELALNLAGVRLRVAGLQNARATRPAVFVFNHQSNLDPMVAGAIVRNNFTATGKHEAKWDPIALLAGRLLDAVYLDRARTEDAKRAINGLVNRIGDGESVIIAPEGTRRAGPDIGEFKHGAFHVARRARVPVVPIVLRNTGALMGPRSTTIKPGVVDVCVLHPVATGRWRAQDVGRHANAIRDRMQATLDRWPAA